jgi:two-component system sensor histidine kinase KdpD
MERTRPNPDQLLADVQRETERESRGKLKIFFGAAAGVGKTYAMLEAAQKQRREGLDVMIGLVETHGRVETEKLLIGLERLPLKEFTYRGAVLRDFDIEAALRRKPHILLVDELAHTNAPGAWHTKRWQDVLELLEAGIDVFTTLNVQHLESVNDIVARLSSVNVRETVPDSIFDQADEVEFVDLTPDDLLQRLREGKVYVAAQAERAMENFFTMGNLIALRELGLRRMADRLDTQMERFRRLHAVGESLHIADRLLVAVGPSPYAPRVVRAARRMAERLHAEWIVAYIETPGAAELPQTDKDRVLQTLRLAEQLGAQPVTLTGEHVAAELIDYARQRSVNKIVVGKPGRARWRDRLFGSMVDELIRNEAGIDIFVVRDLLEEVARAPARRFRRWPRWEGFAAAFGVIAACTLLSWPLTSILDDASRGVLYIVAIVAVALFWGTGPAVAASALSVLAYDFFFVQPVGKFSVNDPRAVLTLLMIFIVGNALSALTTRIKLQAKIARRHEERTAAMYQMTRDLAAGRTPEETRERVESNLATVCGGDVAILLPDAQRRIQDDGRAKKFLRPWHFPVAQWTFDHGKMAGLGTEALPASDSLFLPLRGNRGVVGVVAIKAADPNLAQEAEQMLLIETLTRHAALAFEQLELVSEANHARMQAEAERMQNSLLSSVSHDLRTPLASITGAASSLLQNSDCLDAGNRRELLTTIYHEANRLNRLVTNLLNMTRLEAGALSPSKDWQSIEELVGAALAKSERALQNRPVATRIPADLPLIRVDGLLIEQVFLNILDNAVKYTPAGSPLEIEARAETDGVVVTIADRGPGFAPGDEERVFDKFFRGSSGDDSKGAGLGLTICRGIVAAHGGRIAARNRPDGGAVFEIFLPRENDAAPAPAEPAGAPAAKTNDGGPT